jgi:hypothetical protein
MLKKFINLSLLVAAGAISVSVVLFRSGNDYHQNNLGDSSVVSSNNRGGEGINPSPPPSLLKEPPKIKAEKEELVSLSRSEISERIEKQNQ